MTFPIALQLYSIRGEMEKDFEGSLKAVKEMGYDGVEFAGLFGKDPVAVRALLDELGLVAISAHVGAADILADPDTVLSGYRALGCRYIALPWSSEEDRPGGVNFDTFVEQVRQIGALVKQYDMTLLYHNHDFEFVNMDGKIGLDVLYERVDASLLQTELDVCWVSVGGCDPAEYLKKYSGRAPLVHMKDYWMAGKKPSKLYELIGVEADAATEEPEGEFELRPLGLGVVDVPAVVKAAKEAGAQWLIVEQDDPSMGKTPLECVEIGLRYLQTL